MIGFFIGCILFVAVALWPERRPKGSCTYTPDCGCGDSVCSVRRGRQ